MVQKAMGNIVQSVDGIFPDYTGNIPLGAVRTIDEEEPDDDGNIDLTDLGYVKSVNEETPDDDGNVEIDVGVLTVNDETPDANGNVDVDVGVLTVNNTAPDANGNVNISTDISTCLKQSDWSNTLSNYSVCPFNYANAVFTGTVTSAITDLYSRIGAFQYNNLDSLISALGYVNDEDLGDLAYLDAIEVDGHTSDQNGSVSFNLAGDKYLKSDAYGHITTTNDTPIAIDTSQYTPVNVSNKKVITEVTWNGTTLKYSSENWTFVNGVLVSRTTNNDTTVDTPTVVTWK